MGIQKSLQPGKLAYKWWAWPVATSGSWGNTGINRASTSSQRAGWAALQRARPTCLESPGCLGSSPLSWSLESVSSCWTSREIFPAAHGDTDIFIPCLMYLMLARWWKGQDLGFCSWEMSGISHRGHKLEGTAAPSCYNFCFRREPWSQGWGEWAMWDRSLGGSQFHSAHIHRTPCREDLPGSTSTPRWQTAGRAASGTTLSPGCSPPSRSALCQGGSCSALLCLENEFFWGWHCGVLPHAAAQWAI